MLGEQGTIGHNPVLTVCCDLVLTCPPTDAGRAGRHRRRAGGGSRGGAPESAGGALRLAETDLCRCLLWHICPTAACHMWHTGTWFSSTPALPRPHDPPALHSSPFCSALCLSSRRRAARRARQAAWGCRTSRYGRHGESSWEVGRRGGKGQAGRVHRPRFIAVLPSPAFLSLLPTLFWLALLACSQVCQISGLIINNEESRLQDHYSGRNYK